MKQNYLVRNLLTVAIAAILATTGHAQAHFKTLHAFQDYHDGQTPVGRLILDSAGNLYGVTFHGGSTQEGTLCDPYGYGCGTVFELSPTGGGAWKKHTLYQFKGGDDGANPTILVRDGAGNLYGAAYGGGVSCGVIGCGAIFKLSPRESGEWADSTIHLLADGTDDALPKALALDANGSLFGSAQNFSGEALVFELSPVVGGSWTYAVTRTFDRSEGFALTSLSFDGSGNLLGTASQGGSSTGTCLRATPNGGCGTFFQFSPVEGGWNFSKFAFPSTNRGDWISGPVVEDGSGNLFGVTLQGGADNNGVVFELSPVAGGGWTEKVIHIFKGTPLSGPNGIDPVDLISDGSGGFYGTTSIGGISPPNCFTGCGLVFHLAQTPAGGWQETIVHRFTGGFDGAFPNSLTLDANGNLFGTTQSGGSGYSDGVVFEIENPTGAVK
jgi:hypothetical protein